MSGKCPALYSVHGVEVYFSILPSFSHKGQYQIDTSSGNISQVSNIVKYMYQQQFTLHKD